MPGAWGCGKTMLTHSISKSANADVVIYVACGERGNELVGYLLDYHRVSLGVM